MKILLLQFPEEQKKTIKEVLVKTVFGQASVFESPTIENAQENDTLKDSDIILCFGNPREFRTNKLLKEINKTIPLLFIVEEEIEIDGFPSAFSEMPNYLPIKEVTGFVLEKCIFSTFEKVEIKKRLAAVELLQKEIEIKEQKFKDLFNNSSVGMYEIDPDGKFVMANNILMEMLGLNDFDELSNFNAFKHGFSINGNREELKKLLLEKGEINNHVDIWVNSDNSEIIINEHIKVKKDINGEIEYYQGVVENITQRKEAEEARKRDEIKFKSIVESAIDGIVICDAEGKILIWNKSAENIFGYETEEIINHSIDVLVPEEHREMHNRGFSRFIETRKPRIMGSTVEIEGLRKDGSLVPISISLSHWEDGTAIYFSAILKDITEQKKAEEKLKTSDAIFNHSLDMLCIAGFDGFFKVLNPAWTRILGWSREELLAKPWINFVHPEDRLKKNEPKSVVVDGKNVFQFENRYICKDGSSKWLSWNSFPYTDDKIIICVARDITEKKEQEVELIKSKKEAEKSDRLKSEFLTQISHEIRTPVNTMLSFASLIKSDLGDKISEDIVDSFQYMDVAGKRLIRTIDLLVKISELQTDNYEPEFEEVDLSDLIKEILPDHKKNASEKNIDLLFIEKTNQTKVNLDKYTITDVLNNLIDNAIKFTKIGNVKVVIEKTITNKISISIIDSGIGISEQYIAKIFNLFSQESTGYSRDFDGNGLGLNLVYQYCKLNNVEIIVHSQKMKGSNFTLFFN